MATMHAYLLMAKQVQGKLTQWYEPFSHVNCNPSLVLINEIPDFGKCLFQSGPSGATEENYGVNYRALNDLFSISRSRTGSIVYEIWVQMVEIYNEQVRDLLATDSSKKRYPFSMSYY